MGEKILKIVTFGELLLRLSAPGYNKLFQTDQLITSFCGAEANVAVSLSNFGLHASFVTALPDNDIGHAAIRSLRYFNVDVRHVVFGSSEHGRMGLYYLEKGASQRPSKVIYDRAYSSFALSKRDDFDWDTIFDGAGWFHWTGITPALSGELASISLEACRAAKKAGLTVSCDLNYRAKLWTPEDAQFVMTRILPLVDVCICNEEDAEKVLGLKAAGTDINTGELDKTSYVDIAKQICSSYGCKYVATTLRRSYSASVNGWSAMLYDATKTDKTGEGTAKGVVEEVAEGTAYYSREYDIQLVDRVGGGDSFAAGLIYGISTGMKPQGTIEFATAASCLKQTIEGDFNRCSVADVKELLKSGGNGRVQR